MNHVLARPLRNGALFAAGAALLVLSTASVSLAQTPKTGMTQPMSVTVNFDPTSKVVSVSPNTLNVASGTSAEITWAPAENTFSISSLQWCGSKSLSVTTSGANLTATDANSGTSTQGEMPYRITISVNGKSYSSPDCTTGNPPSIHNG